MVPAAMMKVDTYSKGVCVVVVCMTGGDTRFRVRCGFGDLSGGGAAGSVFSAAE